MSESQKKLLVVLVGLVVFGGITAWKVRVAMRERAVSSMSSSDWDARLETEVTASVHFNVPAEGIYRETSAPRQAIQLARFKLRGRIDNWRQTLKGDHIPDPITRRMRALKGNVLVLEGIDDAAPGLVEGEGILLGAAYLRYAEPLAALGDRFSSEGCVVAALTPGSPAEGAGLQVGDLVSDVDHRGLRQGPEGDPCEPILAAVRTTPTSHTVALSVFRDGTLTELSIVKPEGPTGFNTYPAPFLSAVQVLEARQGAK